MFGDREVDSTELGLGGSHWLGVRRPVRFQAGADLRALAPCVEPIASVEACGGWLERREQVVLAGKRWSLEAGWRSEGAALASLRLGPVDKRMETWHIQGTDGEASGLDLRWGDSLWGVGAGARHRRRVDSLRVRSSEGGMVLAWPQTVDSIGVSLGLPVAGWRLEARWWTGTSRSPEASGIRLADTAGISGWGVVIRRRGRTQSVEARLWREDRQGIATGHREREVFLEQVVESSRAEMDLGWRGLAWDLSLGTRQWRLASPRGRLDHPSIHWNRLSEGDFAPFSSLVEDRSDYLWGTFSVETWDLEAGRRFRVGRWTLHPRWSMRLLDMDADFQRVRLVVKTFLPAVFQDTLARGSGWLVQVGPRIDLAGDFRWGGARAWAGIRFPVAGSWTDRASKPVSAAAAAAPSNAKSLPIDPLGSWEWGGSWEF